MPPISKIWTHFIKIGNETNYKQERAQCSYCSHKLLAAANCCEQHLKKCTKVPHHVFNEYFQQNQTITTTNFQPSRQSRDSASSSSLSSLPPLHSLLFLLHLKHI